MGEILEFSTLQMTRNATKRGFLQLGLLHEVKKGEGYSQILSSSTGYTEGFWRGGRGEGFADGGGEGMRGRAKRKLGKS